MNRNQFLQKTLGGFVTAGILPFVGFSQQQQEPVPFDIKLVKDFVVPATKTCRWLKKC